MKIYLIFTEEGASRQSFDRKVMRAAILRFCNDAISIKTIQILTARWF